MSHTRLVIALLLLGFGPVHAASPPVWAPVPGACVDGTLPGGAKSRFCVPASGWNGDLVIFAHGYTAFNEPLDFQNLDFGDVYLPELVQSLGFAFATTSYRQTGLTVVEGVEDVRELALAFAGATGARPRRIFLTGASEGGIVTALALEKYPQIFAGGLSLCGPIGNFRKQLNYVADFRVVFDYLFPGLLPGDAVDVPDNLVEQWYGTYAPLVRAAAGANPSRAAQLLRVTGAPYDKADPETVLDTTEGVLWYQVFGSEDAQRKLGGNPCGNERRRYRGSADDAALNAGVDRFPADRHATRATRAYDTTGLLVRPLVTLHTTGDEIIPFWHQYLYFGKVQAAGRSAMLHVIPISRYGHCNFTVEEVLTGFVILLGQAR